MIFTTSRRLYTIYYLFKSILQFYRVFRLLKMQALMLFMRLIMYLRAGIYIYSVLQYKTIDDDATASQRPESVEFLRGLKSAYGRFQKYRQFFTLLFLYTLRWSSRRYRSVYRNRFFVIPRVNKLIKKKKNQYPSRKPTSV